MRHNILRGILAVGAVMLTVLLNTKSAFAEDVITKAYNAGLYKCYTNGVVAPRVDSAKVTSAASLVNGNDSQNYVLLPEITGISNTSVSCANLLDYFAGSFDDVDAAMSNLGYEKGGEKSKGVIKAYFDNTIYKMYGSYYDFGNPVGSGPSASFELSFDLDSSGVISSDYIGVSNSNPFNTLSISSAGGNVIIKYSGENAWTCSRNVSGKKIADVEKEIESCFQDDLESPDPNNGTISIYTTNSGKIGYNSDLASTIYQFKNNSAQAAYIASSYHKNSSTARKLTESEVNWLYSQYAMNESFMNHSCNPNSTMRATFKADESMYRKVRLNGDSDCFIWAGAKNSFNGVSDDYTFGTPVSFDDIANFLSDSSADPGEVENPIVNPDQPGTDDAGETGDASDVCYGSRGTLGMSWLLCPVMSWMANSLNWFYDNVVEDYVKVDTSITSNDDVYEAWKIFQNAANIVVVLILLVVIFSQLTGIGIDNYGIKKVLPRLIIFAIVVNLSYFIMQLLVDVSNIIGNSIGNIFQVTGTGGSAETASGVDIPSNILGITVATSAGVGIAAVVANPAILLGLVLVLLSGLISVLMMWVILVTRQALILIAIIIAPIAFASYVLPNTRSFGKRWGSLVKDLLILFPEAAFLIGVSFFASKLLADANPAFTFPAILLRVMPFIALPELFRRSINAIDGLGNRLSSYGNNLSRGATGAMRGADWYKNAQERGIERRTRIRAGLNQDGTEATGWRGILRSSWNDRNRARYRQQYLKNQAEENRARLLNDSDYMDEMRFKQQLDLEGEQEEIKLMNDPNYRKSLKENQREALEKKKKDVQASMLKSGNYTYRDAAGVDQKVDPSNGNHLRAALISELSKGDGEISKINALYDAIRAKGDAGIDILGEVWDSGTINANARNFAEFRDKIVSDGEIKSKARTLHSIAKDVQSGAAYGTAGNQVANARSAGTYVKDIAAEKVPDLTNNELSAFNARAQAGDTVAQETLYRTMANPELNSKVKGADRDNVLWSASQYLQNNFRQINHANDRTETWRDNTGRTRQVGITPEGLRYDKQSGANYGHALDIRQMNANWTRIS